MTLHYCLQNIRWISLTVHAALLFLLFPLHALPLRKHTPAIILPIQPIFMGKFYRPLISVLFLEIRRKMLHFIDFVQVPGLSH